MGQNLKTILILIVLIIAGGGSWFAVKTMSSAAGESSKASYAQLTRGNIESVVTAQGKLEPKEYVDVGAQVSGKIEKLYVDIGDTVKAGDLIAQIDPDIYQSQVAGDEARLKMLQAQKAEQDAQLKQARQKLERSRKLIREKAISQEVLEDAGTTVDIAEAQLRSLSAQIEEAQSALAGNKANLNYTKIFSPMDGTVVSQATKEGQTINASQTAPVIVQIANLDVMTVRAQVAEADISKLKPDMPIYFTTLGSQNRRWKANIRQILPTPEAVNDVVLYNVLVDVDNKDRQLMSGMTTQIFFVLGKAADVNVIPMGALIKRMPAADTDAGKAYEVRALQDGKPVTKTIIIGLSDRSQAEVVSGLAAGDKVMLQMAETPKAPASAPRGRMPRL